MIVSIMYADNTGVIAAQDQTYVLSKLNLIMPHQSYADT